MIALLMYIIKADCTKHINIYRYAANIYEKRVYNIRQIVNAMYKIGNYHGYSPMVE